MVESLGNRVNVIDHRSQQAEVSFGSPVADLVHAVKHAVQYCRQRAMFVLNNAEGLHFEEFDQQAKKISFAFDSVHGYSA